MNTRTHRSSRRALSLMLFASNVLFGNSPMAITQGAFTANGNVNFAGKNVYIDNWNADFV